MRSAIREIRRTALKKPQWAGVDAVMARNYVIGGQRVRRQSLIRMTARERGHLRVEGRVLVERDVEWPLTIGAPRFADAYVDPGGTPIWGPGPYLKVPNLRRERDGDWVAVNRVFCPWGYPRDRLRLSHRAEYVSVDSVELVLRDGVWRWALGLGSLPRHLAVARRADSA